MKRTLIFSLTGSLLVFLGTILYLNFKSNEANNSTELISQNVSSSSRTNSLSKEQGSRIDGTTYTKTYDGNKYNKEALVYVPNAYETGKPMNILYLMHGLGMSAEQVAADVTTLLDN